MTSDSFPLAPRKLTCPFRHPFSRYIRASRLVGGDPIKERLETGEGELETTELRIVPMDNLGSICDFHRFTPRQWWCQRTYSMARFVECVRRSSVRLSTDELYPYARA